VKGKEFYLAHWGEKLLIAVLKEARLPP